MKYRTKLYIALVGTALSSSLLGLGIVYVETRHQFKEELASKVISIAATTAARVDPELLKQIHTRADEDTPAYKSLQALLRKIRNINRNENTYVKFLYTLMPDPKNPNDTLYGVDTEENAKDFSNVGDVNTDLSELSHHLDEPYSPGHFTTDQYGVWFSGFAPVFDKDGNYVGTIGVDLKAKDVILQLNLLINASLWALAGSLFLSLIGASILSRQVTLSLDALCHSVAKIGKGHLETKAELKTHDEFSDLAVAINSMTHGLQERERLKHNFARYVSQQVLEKILKSDMSTRLEGERRKITVLFSDTRHFAKLAEKLPPETVVSLLNEFFDRMLDPIFKNFGTLDKFLGDGIMVEFGAPLDDTMQELHAVATAIEMQRQLQLLCKKWADEGKPRIEMGIGINTGIAIVGNIGSEQRIEYTAIGDTVNTAARLEQMTKTLERPILLSETTYEKVKHKFPAENLGPMTLPGKTEKIVVYAIGLEGENEV